MAILMQKKHETCSTDGHQQCIEEALAAAQQLCREEGLRLTPLRTRVFELVWQSHRPLGAYDILADLAREDGRPAAPPTVYRALDFLLEHGLIHRIATLNAYIGCSHPQHRHQAQFLICRSCKVARELAHSSIDAAIAAEATRLDFQLEGQVIEVFGICADCRVAA